MQQILYVHLNLYFLYLQTNLNIPFTTLFYFYYIFYCIFILYFYFTISFTISTTNTVQENYSPPPTHYLKILAAYFVNLHTEQILLYDNMGNLN